MRGCCRVSEVGKGNHRAEIPLRKGAVKMKEQIVQTILEYLERTEDFLLEQAPEVILQALRYEQIVSVLGAVLFLLLVLGTVVVGYHFWANPKFDQHGSRDFISSIGVMVPCIVSPLLAVQLCVFGDKLIKIYFAPKFFLLQLFLTMQK